MHTCFSQLTHIGQTNSTVGGPDQIISQEQKTVSLESVPISYLTVQRMSLSLLWPFPSHILSPPFPHKFVTNLTV